MGQAWLDIHEVDVRGFYAVVNYVNVVIILKVINLLIMNNHRSKKDNVGATSNITYPSGKGTIWEGKMLDKKN